MFKKSKVQLTTILLMIAPCISIASEASLAVEQVEVNNG